MMGVGVEYSIWGIAWRDTGDRVSIERGFELLDGLTGDAGGCSWPCCVAFCFSQWVMFLCGSGLRTEGVVGICGCGLRG